MNIKVQIILATYNGSKYIKEFLDSLTNQTYKDFSILIADDRSTDDTFNILLNYDFKGFQVNISQNIENLGYYKNFENLYKKSDSDIVLFADQDDVWDLNKVERCIHYFNKQNKNFLYYTELELYNEDLKPLNCTLSRALNFNPKNNSLSDLVYRNVVTGCTMGVHKNLKELILPFPDNFKYHDWWIAVIAAYKGSIYFDNYSSVKYRQHGNNTIGTNELKHNYSFIRKILNYLYNARLRRILVRNMMKRFSKKNYREFGVNICESFIYKLIDFIKK